MTLIILNLRKSSVEIIENVPKTDNLEVFISNLGYKDSEVSYMLTDDNYLTERYIYKDGKLLFKNENLWD